MKWRVLWYRVMEIRLVFNCKGIVSLRGSSRAQTANSEDSGDVIANTATMARVGKFR